MTPRSRHVAFAYFGSGILHAAAIVVMIAATVPRSMRLDSTGANTVVPRESSGPESNEVLGQEIETEADKPLAESETTPLEGGIDVLAEADAGDSQLAAFARQKLQQARNSAEEQKIAEQMTDLESLGRRLNQVSSQESVAAVAEAVAPWIGSRPRATEPVADADDTQPFDFRTAQIIEVHRQGDERAFEYVAVMLDAAGRTQEVPLEKVDGEELYDVFQLMKKFPLLETVYRKAALGLLDTLVAEERAMAAAVPDASDEPQQPGSDKGQQDQN